MSTGVLTGQIVLVFAIATLGVSLATQWTAAALGYQVRLGAPWFAVLRYADLLPVAACSSGGTSTTRTLPDVFLRGGAHCRLQRYSRARAPRSSHRSGAHGNRSWSRPTGPRAGLPKMRSTDAGLLKPAGVFLGRHGPDYLRHDGPEHVMAFAPTRSGKGVGLVVPTLLAWPGSAVIHDIKGENWQLTAGWRARFSHCLLFNPTDTRSAAYNPLLEVRRGQHEVRDVQNIADILVDPEGALERRNHWEKTSHALLVGAILHVLYAEADKTLRGVANFLSDPARAFETTLHNMMTTRAPGRRSASGGRVGGARSAEQERERALRRAFHRDELPRTLSRSDRCRGDLALRLAHRRSDRLRASGLALPGRAALGHQPDEAADPLAAQPDRPASHRIARRVRRHRAPAAAAADARRVPGARSPRLLRERAGVHGGLRLARLPDRAIARTRSTRRTAPITPSSTTATCASPSRPTTSAPPSASPTRWAPQRNCARSATTPAIGWRHGSAT